MASNWQVEAPSQSPLPVTPKAVEQTNSRITINEIRAGLRQNSPYPTAYALSLFSGIGHPRAARIISLLQPAQQMYFCGSSTEIARLSPLLSRPAAAHEGHRVIQFLPVFRRTWR